MGFLQPHLPVVDHETWGPGTRQDKMRPMQRHVAEVGFGTPDVVYVFYGVKIALYLLVAMLFALTTEGIDGFFDVTSWWGEPVVFQKVALWTMLFEVLGLGCGFGPLNLRFLPPLGSFLYWLRPGTIRLAPWPDRVPGTRGTRRTALDAALYAALLVVLVWALLSDASRGGLLPWPPVAAVLGVLAVLGLRDKTIFLAARSEVYGTLAICFLFSGVDVVVAAKLVLVAIWWGAATSKLNRHFPYVVQAMMSNAPLLRGGRLKHRLHRDFPDDLKPSWVAVTLAHAGTVVEYGAPLVLLLSGGGPVTTVAAIVMTIFHLNILVSIPMGVPLEWNVFMIIGTWILFVGQADLGVADLVHPLPVVVLMLVVVTTVALGNLFPQLISFLPGMRYYAGNWDTSVWAFTQAGFDKLDAGTVKAAALPHVQLEKIYGKEQAEIPLYLGYAFRSMHAHGRAIFTLVPRLCGDQHETYVPLDGEIVAGIVLGWNFGDGHLHNEQLVAALQERCHFEAGDVRVLLLHAQPIHKQTQHYRLIDAATGEFERGEVRVADMVARQPWEHDVPLYPEAAAEVGSRDPVGAVEPGATTLDP